MTRVPSIDDNMNADQHELVDAPSPARRQSEVSVTSSCTSGQTTVPPVLQETSNEPPAVPQICTNEQESSLVAGDLTLTQEKVNENETEVEESLFQIMDPPTSSDEATTEHSKEIVGPNDELNSEANLSSQQDAALENGNEQRFQDDQSPQDQSTLGDVIEVSSRAPELPRAQDCSAGATQIDAIVTASTVNFPAEEETERQSTRDEQNRDKQTIDASLNISRSDDSSEPFVNHGLALWERSRQAWLHRNSTDSTDSSRAVATPLDVDEIIDILFTTPKQLREDGGPRAFPQPVALPQMIDILVDLWEAEGLDM